MKEVTWRITKSKIEAYLHYLWEMEKSPKTIEKYRRDLYGLFQMFSGRPVQKTDLLQWKAALETQYQQSSINGKLVAVNGFLAYYGLHQWRMKLGRIQKKMFCAEEKELTKAEYFRLVKAAEQKGNERLSLVLQTICATGIRVSELQFITGQAVEKGRAEVCCKGKRRVIFLPAALQKKLKQYKRKRQHQNGPLFCTRSGCPLNRSNMWSDMKKLCQKAQVAAEKVFPHNLRHLFARIFYGMYRDLAKLADLLGHSSMETTRIYIMESGVEHKRKLEKMGLIT